MKRRLIALLALPLSLVPSVSMATPAAADPTRPDTKLGNFEEAPYRDVVEIFTVTFDQFTRRYVEIPAEHVFNPELLDRTVIIGGREWRDLVIVSRLWDQRDDGYEGGMRFYVFDLFEDQDPRTQIFFDTLNANWPPDMSPEDRQRKIEEAYKAAILMAIEDRVAASWDWPRSEQIVSINGRPWQETEWRDFIIDAAKRLLKPSDRILADPQMWEAFLNPAYNGRAREMLDGEDSQARRPEATPVTTSDQVILTLGSAQVIRYRGGAVETVTLDTPVTAENGVTLVPLRGVLDNFGAQLTYSGDSVTVTDGARRIVLRLNAPLAIVDGREVPLPRPATIRGGRVLVPLRFISEALGYHVTWDQATRQITITK